MCGYWCSDGLFEVMVCFVDCKISDFIFFGGVWMVVVWMLFYDFGVMLVFDVDMVVCVVFMFICLYLYV